MRADVQAILDGWAVVDRREGRRLARLAAVPLIADQVGPEAVIWFQGVEWFDSRPIGPDGEPGEDSGVLVLTATRLVLIGTRNTAEWPLTSIAGFSFHPASFAQGTPPHFSLRTRSVVRNLVLFRRVSHRPMFSHVGDALALANPASTGSDPASTPDRRPAVTRDDQRIRIDAVIGNLAEMRDHGTITQAQFEEELRRLRA